MTLRVIDVVAPEGAAATLRAVAEQHEALEVWDYPADEGRSVVHILADVDVQQKLLDMLQSCLAAYENWRIMILPVEGVVPLQAPGGESAGDAEAEKPGEGTPAKNANQKVRRFLGIAISANRPTASREELYNEVTKGVRLDVNFLLFVVLSTVVAAIGLIADNVAVVIGAMVIAPLLGPNLAFALGAALGDRALMIEAGRASLVGLTVTLTASVAAGLALPSDLSSAELMARTHVGFEDVALALASGAAAVLSLTTGLSSALVGVMVAVALLPPAATTGFMLGSGRWDEAMGAAILLAVNIVCVNLAAQLVFLSRGIGPRTYGEKQKAKTATRNNLIVWAVLLLALGGLIYLRATTGEGLPVPGLSESKPPLRP